MLPGRYAEQREDGFELGRKWVVEGEPLAGNRVVERKVVVVQERAIEADRDA